MSAEFRPNSTNSTNIPERKSAPGSRPSTPGRNGRGSNGPGVKGAIGDSVSVVWQVARRPWMWVALPVTFIAFFVLLSGAANLLFKTATGEQNSLPVTPDGVVSGSAYGVRSIFGATADQVRQGAAAVPGENVYNRPLASPSPAPAAEKEPLQPDVQ